MSEKEQAAQDEYCVTIRLPEHLRAKLETLSDTYNMTDSGAATQLLIASITREYGGIFGEDKETETDPHDELRKNMPEGLVKGDAYPDYDSLMEKPEPTEPDKEPE